MLIYVLGIIFVFFLCLWAPWLSESSAGGLSWSCGLPGPLLARQYAVSSRREMRRRRPWHVTMWWFPQMGPKPYGSIPKGSNLG